MASTCFWRNRFGIGINGRLSAGSFGLNGKRSELFTEDYRLGAFGGAAEGCELFTEDYRRGAFGGAADGCGLSSKPLAAPLKAPSW